MKRTKIVCTIGPASDKKTTLKRLIRGGMNVARLNFSHNVHAYHLKVIKSVRALAKEMKPPIAILQDLQGPRIRLGDLPEQGIELKRGQKIALTTSRAVRNFIPVTYEKMHLDVKTGHRILIADGLIELRAEAIRGREIYCTVVNGGKISSHKGINLPDSAVSVPAVSEKDREDLAFGVKNGVDFVALSFVRGAADVKHLRELIDAAEKKLKIKNKAAIKIIVKIERREAIENSNEIIAAADGVMVARGDLGIELPAEDVPLIQKMLIDKCLAAAKPVIVATQMLESMIVNPRPTRAEVSDVANAVIDHTDAVMLSGETASGKFPAEAVTYMAKTAEATEASVYDNLVLQDKVQKFTAPNEAVGAAARAIAENAKARAILVFSLSGQTARLVSRYRPELPIYVACEDERVARQLSLTWGAQPFVLPVCKSADELVKKGLAYLQKNKHVKRGDNVVVIVGENVGKSGGANVVEVKTL